MRSVFDLQSVAHPPHARAGARLAALCFVSLMTAAACSDGGDANKSGTMQSSGSGAAQSSGNSGTGAASGGSGGSGTGTGSGTGAGAGTGAAGLMCTADVGMIYPMSADPDSGAVDVSEYCLGLINGYRSKMGLAPYFLHSTTPEAMCCQAAEAKSAAVSGGHVNGGCGWSGQGFCGGGRNPNGTVKASVDWCPRLFFEEGPAGGHYQGMMDPKPKGVMCSFYAVSRDRHSIVVNYY
jgi:hypothetical protein